jgi:hypothetical protein
MPEASDPEYAELKKFLTFYADRYLNVEGMPPEMRPAAGVDALEKKSMKMALSGLRQAINDCVEMSLRFNPEEVAKLDEELRDRGLVTLSELRRRYSRKYAAIMKRGRINSDTEYYLIRNVLDDPTIKTMDEREVLVRLVADYEGT